MELQSESIQSGQPIPVEFAFGKYNSKSNVELSSNKNPHLSWSAAPEGTKSYVVICHDSDVPSKGDDVNKDGRTVPLSLERVDFYHWILVDVPASKTEIKVGEYSDGITAKGKAGPGQSDGTRSGLNNYTQWFAGDADMAGDYYGYDGPCPPWNDELLHHYHFTVYALSTEKCSATDSDLSGPTVLAAIKDHTLASASLTGTYHIYPSPQLKG
jgi:Raf kinase inhibitor-like YbhB/YbcL family protein